MPVLPCCVFQRRLTGWCSSTGSQEDTPCVAGRYEVVVRVPCWEGLVKLHGTPLSVGQDKKSLSLFPAVVQRSTEVVNRWNSTCVPFCTQRGGVDLRLTTTTT